jgi:short-subunit dehydrogenase
MKSAIIIGASSGIGRALALTLSSEGYRVSAVARRTDLLNSLQAELEGPCVIKTVDVSKPELAMPLLREPSTNLAMCNSSSLVPGLASTT